MKNTIPQGYVKVGRLRQPIAKAIGRKCADIFISPSHIKHITNKHNAELERLGITALAYVRLIVGGFSEIRKGTGSSILLVVHGSENLNHVAAIEMNYNIDNGIWEVKTAQPRKNADLIKHVKLW